MRALVLLLVVVLAGTARAESFAVVRHAHSSAARVPLVDLRALYLGKQKTWNGGPAVVIVRGEDDPVFAGFAGAVFGVSARTLLAKMKQEVFRGELAKPYKATADADVVRYVADHPTAVGMISLEATRALPADVAVLEVIP